MKCRRCREPAVIDVRRHNAAFCRDCFLRHVREQVRRAIDEYDMLRQGERVLVAVSGGKDSLAAWDILRALGYDADGVYLGLGIGAYSDDSSRYAHDYAARHGLTLHTVDLARDHGYDVPGAAVATRRA
ncbi:MAG: tRNA(Ile)-lysidine synthetase, partial [Actinobacteria bacterium]|nr:tRNA(Ile)-lysidine synthetase [Actinomycetota bacterium]